MSALVVKQEDYRYERKFHVCDYTHKEVEQFIKFHPAAFSEIYEERQVNNIYFDSLGLANYFANEDGEPSRTKERIRWYGKLVGTIHAATLEFKIKKGVVGLKESYKLSPFEFDTNFSRQQIIHALSVDSIPSNIRNRVLDLKPVLLNSYSRKYFLSADSNFRITIDHHMSFYKINYSGQLLLNPIVHHGSTVVELKYDSLYENQAKEIGNSLPFSLTKNSKYVQGLESILL